MGSLKPPSSPVRGGTWVEKKQFDSLCASMDGGFWPGMPVCERPRCASEPVWPLTRARDVASWAGCLVMRDPSSFACLLGHRPGFREWCGTQSPGVTGSDVGGCVYDGMKTIRPTDSPLCAGGAVNGLKNSLVLSNLDMN